MTNSASKICLTMNQALSDLSGINKRKQIMSAGHKELFVIYGPLGRYKSTLAQIIPTIQTNEQITSC